MAYSMVSLAPLVELEAVCERLLISGSCLREIVTKEEAPGAARAPSVKKANEKKKNKKKTENDGGRPAASRGGRRRSEPPESMR